MKRRLKTDELPPRACQLLKINSGRRRGQSDKENWAELSTIFFYSFFLFFLSSESVKKPTEVTRGVQTSRLEGPGRGCTAGCGGPLPP